MHHVTNVGADGAEHTAILFGPADTAVADKLLVFDADTAAPTWKLDVPRSADKAGHSFH